MSTEIDDLVENGGDIVDFYGIFTVVGISRYSIKKGDSVRHYHWSVDSVGAKRALPSCPILQNIKICGAWTRCLKFCLRVTCHGEDMFDVEFHSWRFVDIDIDSVSHVLRHSLRSYKSLPNFGVVDSSVDTNALFFWSR